MLNGLSLFTGYGGIDLALREWVNPILYCEIEKYAQAILLSRMEDGALPIAPVWNDVTTLNGCELKGLVDIVYGGFPCQDISVAGKGAGLEGKRSGLFYEVARIVKEVSPTWVFLENVPAIRTRGAIEVQETLSGLGYDSRWLTLSAAEVGANHKRERWFCLAADPKRIKLWDEQGRGCGTHREGPSFPGDDGEKRSLANSSGINDWLSKSGKGKGQVQQPGKCGVQDDLSHSDGPGCEGRASTGADQKHSATEKPCQELPYPNGSRLQETRTKFCTEGTEQHGTFHPTWWAAEPDVGRVVDGLAFRAHRIKALGNGVVPFQVKTAFEILIGLNKGE